MKKKTGYTVAVVGATGAVGGEMVSILEERDFPVAKLVPLASGTKGDRTVDFKSSDIAVSALESATFDGIDIALFSAGAQVSEEYAAKAASQGAIVIDNTSAFRMCDDIPLVVPEVNSHAIAQYKKRGIISNPNCSTIQMVVALAPLRRISPIKRIVVSTYQSVSGAGLEAMDELTKQTMACFSGDETVCEEFPHRIAFNCIPGIDDFTGNGYTKEEMKLTNETQKILEDRSIMIAATAVRVPVFCSHSEAVNVEFATPVSPEKAREVLKASPGVEVVDDPTLNLYPMPVAAAGKDSVFVGRIRRDISVENGLAMWIVSDNLRKGAALNAVQIAEKLIEEFI